MKKLLLFSIFIGIFCSPVTYAASSSLPDNIGAIWDNNNYFICKETNSKQYANTQLPQKVAKQGSSINSLGKISYTLWDAPDILYTIPATAYKFTCQSNGKFKMENPEYCRTSLHNDNTSFLTFGRYRLLSTYLDRSYHNTNTEQLESARTISYNACIHIGCATGYIYNDANNTCENINTITNAICKEAKTYNYNGIPELIRKLHTQSNPQYYQCGQTPGISNPGCLTVNTQGQGLYCMTKEAIGDSIKKNDEGLLKQTCIENENYVILPPSNHSQPYPYYQCTANGWEEKTLEPCITGHSHCDNVPNCELFLATKSGFNSGTYKSISAFLNVTNINDYCYFVSCKIGFVFHNGQCISEQQEACIDSFGTWENNQCTCDRDNKNLEYEQPNAKCKCKDNYRRDETNKICVPTDTEAEKIACEAMEDDIATWDEANTQCTCHESGYEWKYDATNQSGDCEMLARRAACEQLGTNIARWDTTLNDCKCTDDGQEFRDGQCVDTEDTINQRASAASSAITEAVNALNGLISDANLQTSKWKNAEGKFNTARLASDATAGIVLGTTSALITSKLVKKHQVQDGFEDIHCTIGGQTVADWGDEFTIGIQ